MYKGLSTEWYDVKAATAKLSKYIADNIYEVRLTLHDLIKNVYMHVKNQMKMTGFFSFFWILNDRFEIIRIYVSGYKYRHSCGHYRILL